ncbi:MAG: baseplate J/gp47 family protein [Anaerolineae bacterium]
MKTITIKPTDDRHTLREVLRRVDDERVLVTLPWDIDHGWSQPLDFEVQRRLAQRRQLEMAWVIEDPVRRGPAREAGLPVFSSLSAAHQYLERKGRFPSLTEQPEVEQPRRPWWAPTPRKPKSVKRERPPSWLLLLEGGVLLGVLAIVGVAFALAVPSAEIVLYPSGVSYKRIVPISVSSTAESVDLQQGVIPSQRVGDEFEAYAEVVTSGRGYAFSGRATGTVLLTNLLGQDYPVPAGTVVRTSSGSYPVRYQTTQSVTVPPFGQAEAPVEALIEGPRGNVDAYQINFVEGVVGFAIRVTNPAPITGAESETVRTVSQEDRDRAWDLAAQQVMAQAFNGLQDLAAQEPGRFLPRQSLMIQAAPKTAYTHLVGERSDVLGLALRLLVTGEAVRARDAQAVAYHHLAAQLPEGYTLTDARFSYGEAAEEDVGPGQFTFFLTAYGYAAAKIDPETVQESILGTRIEEAEARLQEELPLSRPPEINVSPSWFPYVPFLPIKTQVQIAPGQLSP